MLEFNCKDCGNRGMCSRENLRICPFDGHILSTEGDFSGTKTLYIFLLYTRKNRKNPISR